MTATPDRSPRAGRRRPPRAGSRQPSRPSPRRPDQLPPLTYPSGLPIVEAKEQIAAAIRDHQVVIVAGETGSGKTTQLPKICLELGRGVGGRIGHTQPRRIAARSVAERIAEELGTSLGGVVGYTVRFTDQVSPGTFLKVMTDGILLAELQRDRMLREYDTLIIDEAHERSLNIDFILGYLKRLLPRRPDLKVIVTSATIDPQRFSRHFDDAPVIEVSGRTYPVEVRYRPLVEADDDDPDAVDAAEPRDQIQAICEAVQELVAEGPGDVLVFLSGEREIRDTADALRKLDLRETEVLPLYARLSASEQHRVFDPHSGRRIVLATNVAETSLTVPGIKYVVDPGTARISRYSYRTKVQRLPIEPISRASANQRKGRCGRTSDGICIRLYSEADFEARPEFTDPEILRTNLASVVLQMAAIGLGDVAAFPFVEAPDRRNIKDGVQLLEELGALDLARRGPRHQLTALGRKLAELPVDPRIARMVIEAGERGCAREVLVVAAALSIQDPRERPTDHQQAADDSHARFTDPDSDFVGYLNLWNYLREKQKELSSSKFRRLCKSEYLNYLRVREWQDLEAQLRQVAKSLGISRNAEPAHRNAVHQSLLAGLLSHIGMRDLETRDYVGARNARFAVFPGSVVFTKQPRWVMAAELVETSRLWGRVVARIEPEWIEPLASHLVRRTYSEPHWDSRRGAVVAYEKVTLYGVPIVASRKVGYGRIDPQLSRELFIRHALVERDWTTHHAFFRENERRLSEVAELENRARRRDIAVDDETLFAFYDERIPADVVSSRHFDSWWKKARGADPDLLTFPRSLLIAEHGSEVDESAYPDVWTFEDAEFSLGYHFAPGAETDGVVVDVPLSVLNRVDAREFSWNVEGVRLELVTALLKSLPKPLRRNFVPAPDVARRVVERLDGVRPGESLVDALADALFRMTGVEVRGADFELGKVPQHLRMTFRVVDDAGRPLAQGKDVDELKERLAPDMRAAISMVAGSIERHGARSWEFGELPETLEHARAGVVVQGFPAVVDEGSAVGVRVFESATEARRAHADGVRRLLMLNVASPAKALQRRLTNAEKLALSRNAPGSVTALLDDCLAAALDELVRGTGGLPRDAVSFDRVLVTVRSGLDALLGRVVAEVVRVLARAHDVGQRLSATVPPSAPVLPAMVDMRRQLAGLVYAGFVRETGVRRLPDVVRYLDAMQRRLDKLSEDVGRDRARMWEVEQAQQAYDELVRSLPPQLADDDVVRDVRWMIEELRVSLFAQTLGTPQPVSVRRIMRAIDGVAS